MRNNECDTITSAGGVAGEIRNYIRRNRLKPGDKLPVQSELGERLNIGLRRLREGMSILEYQGFVETRNKAGTIVRHPTAKNLSEPIAWHLDVAGYEFGDLVRARACMESGAAAEAARNRTARDLLVILDALERLESPETDETDNFDEEEAFHLAILKATHNRVIETFGQLVRLQFTQVRKTSHYDGPSATSNKEHRQIYEAVERRDAVAARELMVAHVMSQLTAEDR